MLHSVFKVLAAIGANDLLQDLPSAVGPDERLGIDVVMHDVFIDGAATSSGTLANMPRRSRSVVMWRKRRSTVFSHEAEVGVKCMCNRGCLSSHACTVGCLWVA